MAKAAEEKTFQEWIDAGRGEGLNYGEQVKRWYRETFPDSECYEDFAQRCERWDRRDGLCETLGPAQWALIRHYIVEPARDRHDAYEAPLGFITSTCFFADPLCVIAEGIHEKEIKTTFEERDLLRFCVSKNIDLTDRGFEIARELGLLRDFKTSPKGTKAQKRGRPGRKGYGPKVREQDKKIYDAIKTGDTWEGVGERFGLKKSEVRKAYDREGHRRKKRVE